MFFISFKRYRIALTVAAGAAILSIQPAFAQTVTERISGASYVNFAKDRTGLSSYTRAGIMCVVHDPECGGGGHNGKDHFFPAKLPDGVEIIRVDYKAFWPNGINHTDRGGWGSSGSYGEDESQQNKPPLVSVHWQNACQSPYPPSGKDWSKMKSTYQISFIVSHPKSVVLTDPAVSADSPFPDVCSAADIPLKPPQTGSTGGPLTLLTNLTSQGTWFGNSFGGLGAAGKLLTIQNGENFELEIIADQNMPGGCGKAGNKDLSAHASMPAASVYGSNVSYPKTIGACAPSSLTPGRQAVAVIVTYQPNQ